jgi:hypothetical protein
LNIYPLFGTFEKIMNIKNIRNLSLAQNLFPVLKYSFHDLQEFCKDWALNTFKLFLRVVGATPTPTDKFLRPRASQACVSFCFRSLIFKSFVFVICGRNKGIPLQVPNGALRTPAWIPLFETGGWDTGIPRQRPSDGVRTCQRTDVQQMFTSDGGVSIAILLFNTRFHSMHARVCVSEPTCNKCSPQMAVSRSQFFYSTLDFIPCMRAFVSANRPATTIHLGWRCQDSKHYIKYSISFHVNEYSPQMAVSR